MKTGDYIRNRRKQLGLCQSYVAQACGVTRSAVCKWQNGDISNAKRDKIEKLARVLQIDPMSITRVELGLDPDVDVPDPQSVAPSMELTEGQAAIIRQFRRLTDEQQLIILRMMSAFQNERILNSK